MIKLRFGSLSYGAANIGNLHRALTDEQAWAILEAAWDAGIRYFDTAPHYGLGLSERRLGAFLATKPRHEFIVSTKAGRLLYPNPDGAGRWDDEGGFKVPASFTRVRDFTEYGIRRSLDESLTRLGLESVDILYLHDPEESDLGPALETGLRALTQLKNEGQVTAIGVGSMSVSALLAGVRSGALDLLMIAGRFTLVDQSALYDVIPVCRNLGVGVVTASVFNSGLLASGAPSESSLYDYGSVPSGILTRARSIAALCADFDVELPAVALQYPLREAAVQTVVMGGDTPFQVSQNAARMTSVIPEALWSTLETSGLLARTRS